MIEYLEPHRRKYLEELSLEDRKLWRRWQIGWSLVYSAVLLVLIGVGYLGPKDTEIAQSSSPGQQAQIARFSGSK
ncbi:hypothetical protein FXV83_31310 [Bradyrhizobium hipponense]|uniref:Uncharacterized protein n=1 Tax=Bradyrhizobium hipponense TaxID=2605638 RepID=A0A5S4YE80_9BRAD|nr:hypothetical protein [Bradyrhizobium hipponense]TYO62706.1 hypothetical protein FXV83_31310 [Bradyrhizobium hipponense]